MGRREAARADYAHALELQPSFGPALEGLARASENPASKGNS